MHFLLRQACKRCFHCSLKILLPNGQKLSFKVWKQKHFHYVHYCYAGESEQFGIRKLLESVVPERVATINTHSKTTLHSLDSGTVKQSGSKCWSPPGRTIVWQTPHHQQQLGFPPSTSAPSYRSEQGPEKHYSHWNTRLPALEQAPCEGCLD